MAKGKELYDVYKPQKQTTMTQVQPYGAAASTANNNRTLYGGSYDADLNALYGQIANRPKFSYDVDGDALYQQYKDRYTQNARMAMQDTMGQAAALTGGYGSSYGQAVGQQAYDRQMLGLTDKIPELQQNAYNRYLNEGNALKDQFGMMSSMAAAEQSTTQQAYSQLAQMISASGYQPTADDLKRAGMNAQQANALRQMWIASNPAAAYVNGALSASDYFKLTGQQPPDVAAAQAVSGGGGGGTNWKQLALSAAQNGATFAQITSALRDNLAAGDITQQQFTEIQKAVGTYLNPTPQTPTVATQSANAPNYMGTLNYSISPNATGLNPKKKEK